MPLVYGNESRLCGDKHAIIAVAIVALFLGKKRARPPAELLIFMTAGQVKPSCPDKSDDDKNDDRWKNEFTQAITLPRSAELAEAPLHAVPPVG